MNTSKTLVSGLASTLLILCLLQGCAVVDPVTGEAHPTNTGVGATIGAVGGAIVGSALGKSSGALIGAGIGAVAGGAIGQGMDRQEALLREAVGDSGVRVVRRGPDIQIIIPDDITFANDSAELNPHFYRTLNKVARILYDFPNTEIKIAGFTSSTGSDSHNQILSERRARSVSQYLAAQDIERDRLYSVGYGKRHPIADNSTARGQALNRRVEITVHAID